MNLSKIARAAEAVGKKYQQKTDEVRWFAFKEDGDEVNGWGDSSAVTNCYSRAMSILGELEIHCVPYGGASEGQMPASSFTRFFQLLKKHGLVPPSAQAVHRNGAHCLLLPREGWDRHTLYLALCFYRQCDQKPNEIMRILALYRRLASRGTSFLQCIHYLATYTSYSSGHYFMGFGPYGVASNTDLSYGHALAWFSQRSKEERLKLLEKAGKNYMDRYTYTFLGRQAKKMLGGSVATALDILDPKHARHYETPTLKEEGK